MDRRGFLRQSAGALTAIAAGAALGCTPQDPAPGLELLAPDGNGVMLPPGFSSRVVARSLHPVGRTGHLWHLAPDGGAVFEREAGWTYVSNSEFLPGGVGAIDFDDEGRIVAARSIIGIPTMANCAGGATPWGTWLTCEEWDFGRVIECDPSGRRPAVARWAMGQFAHEAVAADPIGEALYLTEDKPDGCLYRFVPDRWGDLGAGRLSVMTLEAGRVGWIAVPNPNPTIFDPPCRRQIDAAAHFRGGEGIVWHDGHVLFTTKGDGRVWDLDLDAGRVSIRYDRQSAAEPQLSGLDNVTASRDGGLWVAEDGGNMELVLVTADGRATPVLRLVGQDRSEIAGPAFHPSERRLYFSSQRGTDGLGITYEVIGPFAEFAAAATRASGASVR